MAHRTAAPLAFQLQVIESDGEGDLAHDQGDVRSAIRLAIRIGFRVSVTLFLWLCWITSVA
jgi:hypothetical protein